ncbi:MAG: aminopeptidase P family protein [Candidatus Diapherotrites archaeon]|uniref:Aminopeptidase P family protein n=1 Tax=Candidatus Iainarchaeum sp. TaxID=3101447 RepID=A0A8T4C8W1_9ARCH|nr:aminopeptidase P family protein [Candidatus Diapherotrites archaeon]
MKNNTLFTEEWFAQQKIDTLYTVTGEQMQDPLLTKFTGITHTDFSFRFVQTNQKNILLTSPLEAGTVKQHYHGKINIIRTRKDVLHILRPFFRHARVGVNMNYMTAGQYAALKKTFPNAKLVDVSQALYDSRIIKTREEIQKIKEAAKISHQIHGKMNNFLKKNMSEIELAAALDYAIAREGCTNAYPTIVGFGKNSSNIHHFNTNKKLQKGNMILIDCGAKYEGYCSDLTRTTCFGRATSEQHEKYDACRKAQEESIALIQPGVKASVVAEKAQKIIGHQIPHALGHGIGLETHDAPGAIHPRATWAFSEGMTLAVEPGYYTQKWGIRIEDDVLLTRNGCERLSTAPKKLIEL